MLNIPQLQNRMRILSDEQLQQVVVSPQQPIESTIALGLLSERQKLRSEQQSQSPQPTGSVADQILMQIASQQQPQMMPDPQQMMGQPAQTGVPPIRMQDGEAVSDAITQAIENFRRTQDAARQAFDPNDVPGYMPQLANFQSSLDFLRQYIPDRYEGIARRQGEFDAGLAGRQAMDRNAALLAFGSGLLSSRSPNFLSAIGDASGQALSPLMSAMRRPEEEQLAALQRDMQMAGLQAQRDATLLSGGLEGYQSNAALAREALASEQQAIENQVNTLREIEANREAQANQLRYAQTMMSGGNQDNSSDLGIPSFAQLSGAYSGLQGRIAALRTALINASPRDRPGIEASIAGLNNLAEDYLNAMRLYYPEILGSTGGTSDQASTPGSGALASSPSAAALGASLLPPPAPGEYTVTRTDPSRAGPDQQD